MKVLAIDSSTSMGGVAVIKDDLLLAEYRMDMTMAHAEWLMPLVDRVLRECGLTLSDLDGLAVSIGPGSFTGVRVAVNTAKGLATGQTIKVAAVSTLEALAWNLPVGGYVVCPTIDARKQEVYAGLFSHRLDGGMDRLMEDRVMSPKMLADFLVQTVKEPVVFLGDGALKYKNELSGFLGRYPVSSPNPLPPPAVQI